MSKAMKIFQLVLALAALLQVTIQSFRHAYWLTLEPQPSVLTRFDKTETDIFEAKTLEELVVLYDEASKKVEEWEKGKTEKEKKEKYGLEPYGSQYKIRRTIEDREDHHKKLLELHFFWWCGFGSLCVGVLLYARVNPWVGNGFVIVGFVEMIWWTSPTLGGFFSSGQEFAQLLTWKLIYSVAALALLLGVWWLLGFGSPRQQSGGQSNCQRRKAWSCPARRCPKRPKLKSESRRPRRRPPKHR